MKKISVAIVGYGVVGKRRRKYIDLNKNYHLKYITDIQFKKDFKYNNVHYFRNYKKILLKKIDAVFITLPTYLAAKVTKEFLEKNVHVFCEKPPSRNLNELLSVKKKILSKKNIKLKYGFNHRYHDSIKEAKKLIEKKIFGEIINIRCVYGKSKIVTFDKYEWRSKRKYAGGGILLDQGIHLIDLIIYLTNGKFNEIYGFISNKYWKHNVEDNAFAIMRNSKGLIASIHSSATQWKHKFSIEISLNSALVELNGILSGSKSYGKETLTIYHKDVSSKKGSKNKEKFYFKNDYSWKQEIDEFAKIISHKEKVTIGNINDALKVMETLEEIYNSDNKWKKKFINEY